jgi:hypothetical protein
MRQAVHRLGVTLAAVALAAVASLAFAQSIESVVMPGKLIRGHAEAEADCGKCHVRFNRAAQSPLCLDCHKDVAADVRAATGYHGRLRDRDCRECHTDHKGRDAVIVVMDAVKFDHRQTDFLLRGAHLKTKCVACHLPGRKYSAALHECNDCHRKDDQHKGLLGPKCEKCHTEANWKEARFDHDTTRFPLKFKHVEAKCRDCHADNRFQNTPRECYGCHRKDDDAKGHHGRFGEKCQSCHNEREWKPSTFNHDRDTRYILRDKHRTARCESCHKKPLYTEKLTTTCVSCHRDDDTHKGNLGSKCESCHNERGWKTAKFDHDTTFPLRDKHRTARCESCHKDKTFQQKLPLTCIGCHREDDNMKGHKGRYGEKCESCHTEKSWPAVSFDHARDTKYPLRGKHVATKCDSCHTGQIYRDKLDTTCTACHDKDDKHAGQLGRRCETCHAENDWKRATFDHNRSRFPLLGRHARVECKECHATARYHDAKLECVACHVKDDTHKRRLGSQCGSCHNARDWKIWDFNHDKTRFRLDGAHRKPDCYACHREPVRDKIRLDLTCMSCHMRDDVHHGNFGAQCDRCHTTAAFRPVKMPGSAPTRQPARSP